MGSVEPHLFPVSPAPFRVAGTWIASGSGRLRSRRVLDNAIL